MKLSVNLFTTFDGVQQGPGGVEEDPRDGFDRGGWLTPVFDEATGAAVNNWFAHCSALLLGRRTYDTFAWAWAPLDDPDEVVPHTINHAPKYVVTSSPLTTDVWADSTTVLGADFLDKVRELKSGEGEELQVHGSVKLARALHEAGLVDVYRFLVAPVVVGKGAGIFGPDSPAHTMRLTNHAVTGSGVMAVEYEPGELQQARVEEGDPDTAPAHEG